MNLKELKQLQRYPAILHFPVFVEEKHLLNTSVFVDEKGNGLLTFEIQQALPSSYYKRAVSKALFTTQSQLSLLDLYVWEDSLLQEAFLQNGFEIQQGYYHKSHDPFFNLVDSTCFDEEGYIIRQSGMKNIPYGLFTSDKKGCGWIATYNFLKANGKEKTMAEVSRVLGNQLFKEAFGENIFRIYAFLKKEGFSSLGFTMGSHSCIQAMNHSSSGILLYSSAGGGHFVCFQTKKELLCFYNAVQGKRNHCLSAKDFFQQYQKGIKAMVIYRKR